VNPSTLEIWCGWGPKGTRGLCAINGESRPTARPRGTGEGDKQRGCKDEIYYKRALRHRGRVPEMRYRQRAQVSTEEKGRDSTRHA
jgi:hypothetical protein